MARSSVEVAPQLLGHHLVRRLPGGALIRVRLVETEAYEPDDAASHSFGGGTQRNRTMFGPPGHLYVYLVYGVHHCLNVVTDGPGRGSAVLVRAAEPIDGIEPPGPDTCRGPGRLARTLGVDRTLDGTDLIRGSHLWLERGPGCAPGSVRRGTRIGITKATEQPWRFWISGDPWVSGRRS